MNDPKLADLVAQAFLFRDLDRKELGEIVAAAHPRSLHRDEFYFHQGDPASTYYVLIEGEARMLQVSAEGNQVLLGFLAPGDMFGGVAFIGQRLYPISVEAVQDCTAAAWDGEMMAHLMQRHPRIALNAMEHMSNRIQELQDRVRELSTERVERRIANTLLRLAGQTGSKTTDGILINVALSRQDIAEMTGTTLYTVSRTLSRWEQMGIVESGRERVLIRSPHRLVSIAEDLPAPQTAGKEASR